ncbi:hypothetical protein ACWCPQ_06095 [Nocardia sp. NPDC001965]
MRWRLRGRTTVSAPLPAVVDDYVRRLDAVGGRLYLGGVDPRVRASWTDELLDRQGLRIEFFPATATVGESTPAAYAQARIRVREYHDEEKS